MGGIYHQFSSSKADGADATLVRPSNWNAGHNFVSGSITIDDLHPASRGWEWLGSTEIFSTPNSGSLPVNIVAHEILNIVVNVSGMRSGAGAQLREVPGRVCLQFNSDAASYWDRNISCAVGGTTLTNVQNLNTDRMRVTGPLSAKQVIANITIVGDNDSAQRSKTATWTAQQGSSSIGAPENAATGAPLNWGGGAYCGTGSGEVPRNITTVVMLPETRGFNFESGSGFVVWGRNLRSGS